MKAPNRIETPRLVLSIPGESDAEEIFARYARDEDVTRFLSWPHHRSVQQTRAFIAFSTAEWERWPAGPYLIRSRNDGRLLGGTGLSFEAPHEAMTGYVLAHDAWGQGYATEALRAMIALSEQLGLARLFALCHPAHSASLHVLEKCGFTQDTGWEGRAMFPNLPPGLPQAALCYERLRTTDDGLQATGDGP
jgi:RimJ/RimL family protein N-acetyltransferase